MNFDRWLYPVPQNLHYSMSLGLAGNNGNISANNQMPFPIEALPPILRDAALDLMSRTQGHPALCASDLLGALSTASQDTEIELPFGRSPCQLFLIVSAPSGARKTSVHVSVMAAIEKFEVEQEERFQQEMNKYEDDYSSWDKEHKGIKASIQKLAMRNLPTEEEKLRSAEHAKLKPVKPRSIKLIYSNVTSEALVYDLSENWPYASLASDEAGGILNGRAMRGLLDNLNLLWDGSPARMRRRTSGNVNVAARLTMICLLQPSELNEFLRRLCTKAHGIGLLPRCLFTEIPNSPNSRYIPQYQFNNNGLSAFLERIIELLRQRCQTGNPSEPERLCLRLTPEAEQRWLQIADEVTGFRQFGWLSKFPEYAAKLPNNIGRVAALFSFMEQGRADISVEYVEGAKVVCYWYAGEFVRYFTPAPELPPHIVAANKILDYIVRHSLGLGNTKLESHTVRQNGPFRDRVLYPIAWQTLLENNRITVYTEGRTEYIHLISSIPITATFSGL